MPKWIAAAIVVFSAVANACPDLSGTYKATGSDGREFVTRVSQKVIKGVTHYEISNDLGTSDWVADGVEKTEVRMIAGLEYVSKSKCECVDGKVVKTEEGAITNPETKEVLEAFGSKAFLYIDANDNLRLDQEDDDKMISLIWERKK